MFYIYETSYKNSKKLSGKFSYDELIFKNQIPTKLVTLKVKLRNQSSILDQIVIGLR